MHIKTNPLVSIIINNYNYETYLGIAIDSALKQTYPKIEVVIVDDGSTDSSWKIIESYGDRVIAVLKENGGQASAFNAGLQASSGSILCFLDADDIFYSQKVEVIVNLLSQISSQDILLNNFLEVIDRNGVPVEVDLVNQILSSPGEWRFLSKLGGQSVFFDGQLNQVSTPDQVCKFVKNYRFVPYLGVQTSGITMTRSLANKVFPLPEEGIRISADVFLVKAASLYGAVYSTNRVLTKYRIHENNQWYSRKNKTEFHETKHFFSALNEFLNFHLIGLGKKPTFAYLDSMIAKSYYQSYFGCACYKKLFYLAFKVLSWHIDLLTLKFFIKTALLAIYFGVKHRILQILEIQKQPSVSA